MSVPREACSGARAAGKERSPSASISSPWSQPVPGNRLPPPIRPSGVWPQQRGQETTEGEDRTERETSPMWCSPCTLPPFHPVYPAALRTAGSGTAGASEAGQGAPRVFQAEELAQPMDSPARCSSRFACSARGRTAPRELKGGGVGGVTLGTLKDEHANQHVVKASVGTACLLWLWSLLISAKRHSKTRGVGCPGLAHAGGSGLIYPVSPL